MRIFCIGRNYKAHAAELQNELPEKPVVFMKPESALAKGERVTIPDFTKELHHELEIVLIIAKAGKNIPLEIADEYYEYLSLGIDFTARDIQKSLKAKGLPWELAKSFDGSAAVGKFVKKTDLKFPVKFHLNKNGKTVQQGNTADMIFSFAEIISFISTYFELMPGDLIYTGTPAGVSRVISEDSLEGFLENHKLLEVFIK